VRRSWLRLFLAGVLVLGAIAGYLVSSGIGERLLHQEIETQLSRLLSGQVEIGEVELRFAHGLRLEARGLEAYPSTDPAGPPALRASRVLAWIDLLGLLVGRLELSTLVLEGPHLRIEQNADGSFARLPLPPISADRDTDKPVSLAERIAQSLESIAPVVTAFGERFRAADRIEVIDGTLNWIDHRRLAEDGTPQALRLELFSGVGERDWLSNTITVESRAVFVDGEHTPFPIEFEMHNDESPHFEWTASFLRVPLALAEIPLRSMTERIEGLSGTLNARFHFSTSRTGDHTLDFEAIVKDAQVSLHDSESIIRQDRVELRAELALDEKHLRIAEAHLIGERLGTDFNGTIDRPIRLDSRARFEARMIGKSIKGIRLFADRFDDDFEMASAVLLFTERIESGQLRYIQAAGTARLRHWLDLATGRSQDLPDGFVLGAGVDDVTLASDAAERIEVLSGELEWVGDQVSLRNMNAIYNGTPMPEMNLVIDGLSHLVNAPESARAMTANPPGVPGVMPLAEILRSRDPNALPPVKTIGLAIDALEHPLLRYPLRDARVLIEPRRRGMRLSIREGIWGGAAIEGDLVWFDVSGSPHVRAEVVLGPPQTPMAEPATASSEEVASQSSAIGSPPNADRWGSGRFELEFRPRPSLPFLSAVGYFRLDGSNLIGNEVEVGLAPTGKAALRTSIDLRDPDSIDLDLSFAITEGTFAGLSEFVVLPPELVSGDVGATGSLAGLVRPNTSFIAELDGRVRVEAEDGQIETTLPLLLRIGKASEGYNPFADADELEYESMTGTIEIDHGRLTIEDFEIEGPLRVFANAHLDTNRRPGQIRAVVGIFLFRSSGQIIGNFPLVRSFLPGSKRGLIGAYFEVEGPIDEPDVDALPLQTLMSSVPDAIKAPFKVMKFLFSRDEDDS
jgi:hypothetical protein